MFDSMTSDANESIASNRKKLCHMRVWWKIFFLSTAPVLVLLLVQVEVAGAFAVHERRSCFFASTTQSCHTSCKHSAQKTQQCWKAPLFSNKNDVEILQETNEEGSPPQKLGLEEQSTTTVDFRRQRNGRQRLGGSSSSRGTQRRRSLSRQRSGVHSARSKPVAFDPISLTKSQKPNHDAVPFHLNEGISQSSTIKTSGNSMFKGDNEETIAVDSHRFEFFSLDDLFPGTNFSKKFDESQAFREELRQEIRQLVFDHNPSYSKLPTKARQMLLSDGSSVEGSWFVASCAEEKGDSQSNGFTRLTEVLKRHLDCDADEPTGEQLISTIGRLCGGTTTLSDASSVDSIIDSPSGHFIDIIGRKDRVISHSWHQDTGRSGTTSNPIYTVLWGFPPTDNHCGTGVYSHMIPLEEPHIAMDDHPMNEPIVFPQLFKDIDDNNDGNKYIIKPLYQKHCEILRFKDTHYLHSAPDVTYRSSLMRFM